MSRYQVEPWEETQSFPCADCGETATRVAGDVRTQDGVCAVYRISWVASHVERVGHLAIGLGRWDEGAVRTDRRLVELRLWHVDRYPSVAVLDSPSHRDFENDVLGVGMRRAQVVGTPLAAEVFAIADHVMFLDPRVLDFLRTDRWPSPK